MRTDINYEQDILIEEDALDIECLNQPSLMLKYCRLKAELDKNEDLARDNRDLIRSEIDKEVREDPEKFGIGKLTEGAITSVVLSDERYGKANQDYINAKFEAKVAAGAVRSFDQRKNMLETLAKLHGQQYFAGPKTPRDLSYEALKRKKQERSDSKLSGLSRKK